MSPEQDFTRKNPQQEVRSDAFLLRTYLLAGHIRELQELDGEYSGTPRVAPSNPAYF